MGPLPATLAVVFDFDDTLVPDSTSKLLQAHGIDPQKFWTVDAKERVQEGYDSPLAYLNLLLENVGDGRPLGRLTNEDLRAFGSELDEDYYPGLPQLFDDLRGIVSEFKHIDVEFYVISGGLLPIVEGTTMIREHFAGVYACEFGEDPDSGVIVDVKRCVTFTEKTRYLFEINKGVGPEDGRKNPQLVNRKIQPDRRRVPFPNIFYVGDGLTDIPCFSVVQQYRGTAFGVFDPGQKRKAKRAFQEFLKTDRVISMHAPRYREDDELGALLRAAVATRCSKIQLEAEQAEAVGDI